MCVLIDIRGVRGCPPPLAITKRDMSEEYLKEMRELERQELGLKSQYTDEEKRDVYDYKTLVNSSVTYTPHNGESWKEYAIRMKIYAGINAEKNRLTHIDGPRKAWYTHRNAAGCFMCNDTNLISVLVRVLCLMGDVSPDNRF